MKDKNEIYLNVEIRYIQHIAHSFLTAARRLYDNDHAMSVEGSYHLLITTSFELLLKVSAMIEMLKGGKKKDAIIRTITKDGHNIDVLARKCTAILESAGVIQVEALTQGENGFVAGYALHTNDGRKLLLHELEGIRYGTFARNQNVMYINQGDMLLCVVEQVDRIITNEVRGLFSRDS